VSLGDSHNHAGMPGSSTGHANLKQLWTKLGKGKSSYREFASQIFTAAVPTAALYSQDLATVVSFYLEDTKANIAAREEIIRLDASTDADAAAKAMVYFYEALREFLLLFYHRQDMS
jgi:linoleate 10R-lipoxygenase